MPKKVTERRLQSLKKSNANKDQRLQLKERARERRAQAATRQPRSPRRRDWVDAHEDDRVPAKERMRAPGSAPPATAVRPEVEIGAVGTVIEVRSGDSLIAYEGRILHGVLPPGSRVLDPTTRSPLAVGDRVQLSAVGHGQVRIISILPRRSALSRAVYNPTRRDPAHQGQVMAANIDQVIIVCSPAEPPFRPRLIDRYLVAASRDGLPAIICLNKVDLSVGDSVDAYLRGYRA